MMRFILLTLIILTGCHHPQTASQPITPISLPPNRHATQRFDPKGCSIAFALTPGPTTLARNFGARP